MRKSLSYFACFAIACLLSLAAFAQNVTISGNVKNSSSKENVAAVSVVVKGTSIGTFTDDNGNFKLTVSKLPVTLVITSVGFESKEVTVSNGEKVSVEMSPVSALGQEVVVAATRSSTRLLESPVSIERVGAAAIRNAAAPTFYEGLANLKGVDMTTSSLNFRTISTRGFNGSGNLRFNQFMDGMDNQAPGLNFSVGNILGITELDMDNVELLPGASSALYGSGGMNGTMLLNSKNPFKYQGLSFQVRQGINHTDSRQRKPAPFYDWNIRWAKAFNNKFAFKMTAQLMSAQDWQATDTRNLQRENVISKIKSGDRVSDPNYDGVNVFGDEASVNMGSFAQVVLGQATAAALPTIQAQVAQQCGCVPTAAQIQAAVNGFLATNPQTQPFYLGLQNGVYGNQFVSRTGYDEKNLVDYANYNVKLTGGLYYKITNNIEASLIANWGTGTTVYTGADRYAIQNLKMGQYKLEFKGKNWDIKAYTTQENSGDAYTATTAAVAINNAWKSNSTWFGQYVGTYSGARLQAVPEATAHALARAAADAGRYLPGSPQFNSAFQQAKTTSISKGGAKFDDKTDLYHLEGQLTLTDYIKVADVVVGANYRQFRLKSNGTIFADTAGTIPVSEYGGYIQVQKKLFGEILKLTASGRYDKNENFNGRFTPRFTALVKVAKDQNIRLSYQTAYRFPSTQDQWINLQTPASRLIGGLPSFYTYFNFANDPAYTSESIVAYRQAIAAGNPNAAALLKVAPFANLKPETAQSYELGYKALFNNKFLIDVYGYYSEYKDFIARVAVGRGQKIAGTTQFQTLANPLTTENLSFVTNSGSTVKAFGYGISFEYQFAKGYALTSNFTSDDLRDVQPGLITFFNTPKYRFNIGLSSQSVGKSNVGFNLIYRWQDEVNWEGTFGAGPIPSYGTFDAQVSYKFTNLKSLFKIGATNLLNKYYRSAFGNPQIGGLYYVSWGYNVF